MGNWADIVIAWYQIKQCGGSCDKIKDWIIGYDANIWTNNNGML